MSALSVLLLCALTSTAPAAADVSAPPPPPSTPPSSASASPIWPLATGATAAIAVPVGVAAGAGLGAATGMLTPHLGAFGAAAVLLPVAAVVVGAAAGGAAAGAVSSLWLLLDPRVAEAAFETAIWRNVGLGACLGPSVALLGGLVPFVVLGILTGGYGGMSFLFFITGIPVFAAVTASAMAVVTGTAIGLSSQWSTEMAPMGIDTSPSSPTPTAMAF